MKIEDFLKEKDTEVSLDAEMLGMLEKAEKFDNLMIVENSILKTIVTEIKKSFGCY